jgi:hypothetical protein
VSGHPDPQKMRAIIGEIGEGVEELGGDVESPTSTEREQMLQHLSRCGACRNRLAELEPSALFALLSLRQPPAAALDALSRRVSAAIEIETVDRRPVAHPRFAAVASLAASVLLAISLGVYFDRGPVNEPDPFRADLESYLERLDRDSPLPGVELISSPGEAQVVDLEVGDTQVVMIFDKAIVL